MGEGISARTATVLFSDLVGSTELSASLGEAVFDGLRRTHFGALRDVLARLGGREVKTLGDGVLAVFDSAADAVRAAVSMQQAVDRQARSLPAPLAIRIGLALGDVSFEDDDVFGSPVVEAARLVQRARGGQILATAMVRWAGGGRSEATFSDVGELELKGLPDPVPACEVVWEPAQRELPLPSLLARKGRIFVGRHEELERLGQLWKEAAAGGVRLALLAGEPGVGKTRLAAELAGRVHGDGATVVAGRCDEDLGVPYQPFVVALRDYATHAAEVRLGRHQGELTRLVPELAERFPVLSEPLRSDPETERYRLFDAVAAWLADASAETPLLFVLDDLHWGAKPTLLLLRHIARSPEPMRLLVVVTYRDTELGHDHPLVEFLADLRRQGGVERFSLTGLDSTAVGAFMEAAAGHPLDDEGTALARAIYDETEGNPFFVREVLRHLTETGEIFERDGHWFTRQPVEDLGIPEGVREVVGRRLSRLSAETNGTLRLAAVVGTEFEVPVVRAAGDLDEETLLSALDEAIDARLVTEVPGRVTHYRFAHALVRATLYDGLSAARRVTLHRRVAETIESLHAGGLDDHLPALAHHWARASAPAAETARAVDYAARAGDRALAQLAHHEAVSYYRQALELLDATEGPPAEARRLELFIALGEAQRRAGDVGYRQTLLDAAALAGEDPVALARAALANSRVNLYSAATEIDAERVAVLESALTSLSRDQLALRSRLLANLGLELTWSSDRSRRLELSDEALASARRVRDPATLAHVLLARDYAIAAPDNVGERLANTEELVDLAEVLGDPVITSRAWTLRFRAALEMADVDEASRCLVANEALTAELGQPSLAWPVMMQRAGLRLLAGELDAAEQGFLAAYQWGVETGQPDASNYLWAHQLAMRFERGRSEELEETVRMLAGLVAAPVQLFGHQLPGGAEPAGQVADTVRLLADRAVVVKGWLATLQAEAGRLDEARPIFDELAASGFVAPFDFLWLRFASGMASLCAQLGDEAHGPALYGLLEPYADRLVTIAQGSVVTGSVSHYLGQLDALLGRFDQAEARFAAATAAHARIAAPAWLARTRLEWARMLLARDRPGDAERSRELVDQVLAAARHLGLAGVEHQAAGLLG